MSGRQLLRFVASRLVQVVAVMFFVSLGVFVMTRSVPGSPASIFLGPDASAEQIAEMERQLGLHQPLYVQYVDWLREVLTGGLGRSLIQDRSVADMIYAALPVTLQISAFAMLFVVLVGVPAGVFSAVNQYTWKDYVATVTALVAFSSPQFFTGILLILLFSLHFELLPALGFVNVFDHFMAGITYTILPGFALGAAYWGVIVRMQRSSMLDVLNQEYVDAARARGIRERAVIYSHALRNALIPVVTIAGLQIGWLLNGSILIERVFSLPGIGDLLVTAIFQRDYAVVQGVVLFIAFVFVVVNLVVDVVYALIDPRIRYDQ